MRRLGATLRGFGSYHISNNSILKGGMSPPMITNSVSNGAVIVRHREYLRDIFPNADQSFKNEVSEINPGLQNCFPWLAQIAPAFQQYRFRGLVFEYKTTSSDLSVTNTNSALGTVVMATQYNALDDPFQNKYEMENWEFSTSCKPSISCLHPVECAKGQTPVSLLWVRTGTKPGDQRLYDLGNFNIATVGIPGNGLGAIGELWVSYEIEFFKPMFIEDSTTQFAHFSNAVGAAGELTPNPPTSGHPFGLIGSFPLNQKFHPLASTNSTLPCYLDPTQDRLVITDSIAKDLMIVMRLWWNTGVVPATTFVPPNTIVSNQGIAFSGAGWNLNSSWYTTAQDLDTANPTTRASTFIWIALVKTTSDNAIFKFTTQGSWLGSTPTNWDLYITEMGPNPN
ncbi:capsid protein [Crucivirus-536]|nr:capsid protein [Crucivirus-536]